MITVFTYNRPDLLKEAIKPILKEKYIIIDDGSDVPLKQKNVLRVAHQGKKGFWRLWACALHIADLSDDDFFLFMPDDFLNIDLERIKAFHETHKDKPYFCNVINDGRTQQWVRFNERPHNADFTQIGFVDCGFFCNRSALQKIGFNMTPIDTSRMAGVTSSGVGMQLTNRISRSGVPIYKPIKSMAYHGDHDSVMHPEERKKIPLRSI